MLKQLTPPPPAVCINRLSYKIIAYPDLPDFSSADAARAARVGLRYSSTELFRLTPGDIALGQRVLKYRYTALRLC